MVAKTVEKKSDVQEALAALRKKDSTVKIGLDESARLSFSTGNILLDDATSVDGIPSGRVIEFYGQSQSGKTTAALMTAAEHQKNVKAGKAKGAILFLDYERSIDKKYAKELGVDIDDEETFIYVKPRTLEQGANIFRSLMSADILALCIIDSVAAMVSEREIEAETGKASMADRAKALHQFFRQITGEMEERGVSLILLNHVMQAIDISPMGQRMAAQGIKKDTTPGGTAVVFYSSMRIKFVQIKQENKTEYLNPATQEIEKIVTAYLIQATVVKNKVGVPQRIATMQSRVGKGFSQPYTALQILVAHKTVKDKAGGRFDFPEDLMPSDGVVPVSKNKVIQKLEDDPEWLDRLVVRAKQVVKEYRAEKANEVVVDYEEDDNIDPVTGEVYDD